MTVGSVNISPLALLELDLCAGQGWGPLCQFLGLTVPEEDFPWTTRVIAETGQSSGSSRLDQCGFVNG